MNHTTVEEVRRAVLREVFEALSGNSEWVADDRFEHYPLDVQAIAQLSDEICTQRIKGKEAELGRKSKLSMEKTQRAFEQRCLADKQAIRIEAEADKKQMGIEITRVKKRLIEAEREKHLAVCEKAQAQRDARNMKNDVQGLNTQIRDTEKLLKKKSEELIEMERRHSLVENEQEREIQNLNERVLNFEAKLNNQQAFWEEKQASNEKAAAEAIEQAEKRICENKTQELRARLSEEIACFEERICCLAKRHQNTNTAVLALSNTLVSSEQSISEAYTESFREFGFELSDMLKFVQEVRVEAKIFSEENHRLTEFCNTIANNVRNAGCSSLQELIEEYITSKKELVKCQEAKKEQECQVGVLSSTIKDLTRKEEDTQSLLKELSIEVESLQTQLTDSIKNHESTQHIKEFVETHLENLKDEAQRCKQQIQSMAEELQTEQELKEETVKQKSQLEEKLCSLTSNHEKEMKMLEQDCQTKLLSSMKDFHDRWFGTSQGTELAVKVMKESLCDVTTNSGVRALKLSSQLRNNCTPKRRTNSAIQFTLSRVKNELETILAASDLERILSQLKSNITVTHRAASQDTNNELQLENDDFHRVMLDIECCLFWTILDARVRRETNVEEKLSSHKQESKGAGDKVERRKSTVPSINSSDPRECKELASGHGLFKDKEAAEILEVISVLKEYLQKEQKNEVVPDGGKDSTN